MSLINDALKRARQTQNQRPPERLPGGSLEPVLKPAHTVNWMARVVPVALVLLLLGGSGLIWRSWKTRSASQVAQASPTNAPAALVTAPAKPADQPAVAEAKPNVAAAAPVRPKVEVNTNLIARPVPAEAEPAPKPSGIAATMQTPFTATASALAGNKGRIEDETASAPPSTPVRASVPATVTEPAAAPVATPRATRPPAEPLPASADFPALKLQGVFYRITKPSVLINGQTLYVGDMVADVKVVKIERQSVTVEWRGQQKTLTF